MVEGIGNYFNKRWEIQEKYRYFENENWIEAWRTVFWCNDKTKCEEVFKKYKRDEINKEKLQTYGFSEFVIDEILKGKVVNVSYGKVRFEKENSILSTFYQDGKIKKEEL